MPLSDLERELVEALRNLTGIAQLRGAHLGEYRAALDEARAALASAERKANE